MKKVLIFGAGGFVGSYLSNEFLEHGYTVIGSDRSRGELLPKDVVLYTADLMDSNAIEDLINKELPDIIINLAAISSVGQSWSNPQTTMMVNVVGALNILEAARKCKKKPKVMFIGSSEEYVNTNEPINEETELNASNPYGISKVTQERFAKLYRDQYGLYVYCVRPFNHTGVGQRDTFVLPSWCKQVAEIEKSGKPGTIKVGNIKVKRDFSHVKDIVRAYRMIVESDNCERIYNVGSGVAYPLDELLNYIIGLSNQKIDIEVDESRIRPTDQENICCDYKLINEELVWTPKYTVRDALKEMYNNYLDND
jgi:GDP-4-dehydro-6-deoxy-D-mannose reductase